MSVTTPAVNGVVRTLPAVAATTLANAFTASEPSATTAATSSRIVWMIPARK